MCYGNIAGLTGMNNLSLKVDKNHLPVRPQSWLSSGVPIYLLNVCKTRIPGPDFKGQIHCHICTKIPLQRQPMCSFCLCKCPGILQKTPGLPSTQSSDPCARLKCPSLQFPALVIPLLVGPSVQQAFEFGLMRL